MCPPSAFALDLFGFDVYTFPRGAAGAMSLLDPLEGTETRQSLSTSQLEIGNSPATFI